MTMDSPSSAKRPRTDSTATNDVVITRSPVWYSDGSVVLQAELTQFRVHASILSAGSSVFKDMFEVAQAPINPEEQVEGCPLIHLYDDSAQEVEVVLMALYDRNFYKKDIKSFLQVAAMWRLGKKYEFDELRDDALHRLESTYPNNLADYQAFYHPKASDVPPKHLISMSGGLLFEVIELARATGLNSILPAAFYRVCSKSRNQRAIHEYIFSQQEGLHGMPVQLSDSDKRLCILATSDLLEKQWKGPYTLANNYNRTRKCSMTWDGPCVGVPDLARSSLGGLVQLVVALEPAMLTLFIDPSCTECKADRQTRFAAAQLQLWEELPSIFGLPSWGEIKKQRSG
ncbi:hypothetical protein B0H15DRAFT_890405 [Mycena belliarum]|uniref:BTB domain-containing protein n=1 Tax=Mycena belliarum TaxID=1033014 RepID=A0AAD6XKK6_9AGAR|nr:hypothetical protein B0H15DRAFT_890405 [Mycena belliae]